MLNVKQTSQLYPKPTTTIQVAQIDSQHRYVCANYLTVKCRAGSGEQTVNIQDKANRIPLEPQWS